MNIMFAFGDTIVTPMLNGSILPGITRDSILTLANDFGYTVEERRMSIEEVFEGARSGKMTEAFGTGHGGRGLARGVALLEGGGHPDRRRRGIGPITQRMYDALTAIQRGEAADPHGWSVLV